MRVLAYIDPGTTGLLAQFAAAGFAGIFLYLRSRFSWFSRNKGAEEAAPASDESAEKQA